MTKEQKDKILQVLEEDRDDYASACKSRAIMEQGKIMGADYMLHSLRNLLETEVEPRLYKVESEKLEIALGDEVVNDYGTKGVVVGIDTTSVRGDLLSLLMKNYNVPQLVKVSSYKKTGRHFPQIIEVLEQIKGEVDEKQSEERK